MTSEQIYAELGKVSLSLDQKEMEINSLLQVKQSLKNQLKQALAQEAQANQSD